PPAPLLDHGQHPRRKLSAQRQKACRDLHHAHQRLGHHRGSGGEFETGAQTKSVLRWGISDRRELRSFRLALTPLLRTRPNVPEWRLKMSRMGPSVPEWRNQITVWRLVHGRLISSEWQPLE